MKKKKKKIILYKAKFPDFSLEKKSYCNMLLYLLKHTEKQVLRT